MSRQEAVEQYAQALKRGRKTYKEALLRGRYPYPQVLDEILDDSMTAGRVELGLLDIPAGQVTGTKTAGRKNAFAADFMPLMEPDTEFATKWVELCAAHLSDEGIRDPIRCFEYLGRFYVQEGNKRVSVLKSYDAPTIPAYVTRIIPGWSSDPVIQAYYEFLHAWELTGLYQVSFSRPGCFPKLQTALGHEPEQVWTEAERRRFSICFAAFQRAFQKLGGDSFGVTVADALLVWLKVYPYDTLWTLSDAELTKQLRTVWSDVALLAEQAPISLSTEAPERAPGILDRIVKTVFADHLNVAFVSNLLPEESDWSRAHDLGRQYLEAVMADHVTVQTFHGARTGPEVEAAMERAAEGGAQVLFATTPTLIGACRKFAAAHPDVRVLNCSASMPYAGVRTYYSRIYEGKFITGAIAGAMCKSGQIGYVASNPIFGVPASINAFALGVQLTNPAARVRLDWSCVEGDAMARLAGSGSELISNRDVPTPDRMREPWGLCQVWDGSYYSVASPYWHWGNFYVKLVRTILNGGWEDPGFASPQAVNYWWGMKSQVVGVLLRDDLPEGVRQLADMLRREVAEGGLLPFARPIRSQDGRVRSDGSHRFSPEEILHMDWLCEGVEGAIPPYDALLPMARPLVRLQGIYRDAIPPEKEDPIL